MARGGPVDLSLLDGDGSPAAFLELKWGAGTFNNCVWDLAKMAVVVARGLTPRAYQSRVRRWPNGTAAKAASCCVADMAGGRLARQLRDVVEVLAPRREDAPAAAAGLDVDPPRHHG